MRVPRRSDGDRRGPPQQGRRIATAMMLLPVQERAILFHAYYLNWTVEQIGLRFELSHDVVKLRLHEALRRLLAAPSSGQSCGTP